MQFTALTSGILFSLLLACTSVGLGQTDFVARHQRGLESNPVGVRVELRSKGGHSTFHLFEPIPIELQFSSTRPSAYTVEMDEAMNSAGQSDSYHADPAGAILVPSPAFSRGIVCCASNRRYLSARPVVLNRTLTDYLRFEQPGEYSVFFSTRRIFRRMQKWNQPDASDILLTSNVLTLTILPEDPAWDAGQLTAALRKLDDPAVLANYAAVKRRADRMQSETGRDLVISEQLDQTEFVLAAKDLRMLDTPQAIHERIQREFGGAAAGGSGKGPFSVIPLLDTTTRPDLVIKALEQRAGEPEFGVTEGFVADWARFIVQRDHQELFRPSSDEQEHWKKGLEGIGEQIEAERQLIPRLQALLSGKTSVAQTITSRTIETISQNTAPRKQPPPAP
ncbi:MAG TPA: hypothetical protein VMI93_03580 [Candidatus Solibacter sp.]|nr:hypothetical protein [Candidatus Solibacter sp.]